MERTIPNSLTPGISGQDSSNLAELLLSKGYEVVGTARHSSAVTLERIAQFHADILKAHMILSR